MGKEIETEEIKEIEIKLEKLKIPKTIFNTIKKINYFREIFVSHFMTQKILCLMEDLKVDNLKQMA